MRLRTGSAASNAPGANPCTANFTRHPKASTFWVAQAVQNDGDIIVSAPDGLDPWGTCPPASIQGMPASTSAHPVRPLTAKDRVLVERLRKLCLCFPEANERISHGEPTWFAGKGKVFAMLDNHHHGSDHLAVWLPQPPGVQQGLIDMDPALFFRPPYVGPGGWVGVVLDTKPDWALVQRLVLDAFRHVATQKLRRALDESSRDPGAPPPARPAAGRRARTARK